MKRARVLAIPLALAILLGAGAVARARMQRDDAPTVPKDARAPDGARIKVEVLNGTRTRGLARRATMLLRDRGFDVLETGTSARTQDTTLVLDVSGHPDWANRVAKMFGAARVEARPDSSSYLDVTVVIGATWRPPAEPFYP
ncbi:MAG TPA: LytR C-terminal domain-containing protein [Gemmatimonadaceae bacterium]|nr:LytR C-terminal domain-containing protein [Gemmatimonadaceae bacterium]